MVGCWVILGRQANLKGRSRGGSCEVVSQQWSNKTSTGESDQETTPTFLVTRYDRAFHYIQSPSVIGEACCFLKLVISRAKNSRGAFTRSRVYLQFATNRDK